jgi:flavin reductase (DIM6/NTAB) family NADH-FMN oxidoreductase RutF
MKKGDMIMNADEIRMLLQNIINGLVIVTTKSGDRINGMTCAWASQVAWEPPLLMVSIGNGSYTNELIQESKVFAVNVLNEDQVEIGKKFGLKSGRNENKFENIEYVQKTTGSPILNDVVVYFDCKLHSIFDVIDHKLFIGEIVEAAKVSSVKPLHYNYNDYW